MDTDKANEIENMKILIKNNLSYKKINKLSLEEYIKFIYEFFEILTQYKNKGMMKEDIESFVNELYTKLSYFFDGNGINEDKFGFITEELISFCPSPFFWDVPLEEYMQKWEKLYFPILK